MAAKKKSADGRGAVVAGVGAAVATAAAAAAFYLYGPKGKKHRKQVKVWAKSAEKEVAEGIKKMKALSEPAYKKLVKEVGQKYAEVKKIDKKDVEQFAKEFYGHFKGVKREWDKAKKEAEKKVKKGAKRTTKTVKKTVNKTAKKVVKATA
jgi:hypothetical protein